MTRLSLTLALAAMVVGLASPALAAPGDRAADDALAAESAALPTPSLALRLKVRAATYRAVLASKEAVEAAADHRAAQSEARPLVVAARVDRD